MGCITLQPICFYNKKISSMAKYYRFYKILKNVFRLFLPSRFARKKIVFSKDGHARLRGSICLTKQGSVIFWFMAFLSKVYLRCHMTTIGWTNCGFILANFSNLLFYGDTVYTDAKCLIASKA